MSAPQPTMPRPSVTSAMPARSNPVIGKMPGAMPPAFPGRAGIAEPCGAAGPACVSGIGRTDGVIRLGTVLDGTGAGVTLLAGVGIGDGATGGADGRMGAGPIGVVPPGVGLLGVVLGGDGLPGIGMPGAGMLGAGMLRTGLGDGGDWHSHASAAVGLGTGVPGAGMLGAGMPGAEMGDCGDSHPQVSGTVGLAGSGWLSHGG
jgi:hypothetical protein